MRERPQMKVKPRKVKVSVADCDDLGTDETGALLRLCQHVRVDPAVRAPMAAKERDRDAASLAQVIKTSQVALIIRKQEWWHAIADVRRGGTGAVQA